MDLIPSPSFLVTDPIWSVDFAPNGTRVGAGDLMTRKRYADLLEEIANHGPDVFYNGPIAESTVAALRAANGIMTVQDLADYKVAIRPVKQISYREQRVYACSVPAGGVVVLNVLKTVEGYSDFGWPAQLDLSTHRLTEAIRFGYGLVGP
jgi:gamma-glutamyltranspeptidase / glutathione hydrolase